jgi:hypothetical protein
MVRNSKPLSVAGEGVVEEVAAEVVKVEGSLL